MKKSDILIGRDHDQILQASLFERLKILQPVGDHSIFEKEEIRLLRPRVAAFEQQEAQKLMRAYQAGPHTKRVLGDALIKLAELAAMPMHRHFAAPYASSKIVSYNPVDEVRDEVREIIRAGLNTLKSKQRMPVITDRPPSSTEETLRYARRWWLVSPIDSIDHPDVSISIAMIEEGKPLAGIVHLPRLGRSYAGAIDPDGFAIAKTAHKTRTIKVKLRDDFRRVAGAAHNARKGHAFTSVRHSHRIKRVFGENSAPYALCRLAQGSMDMYLETSMLPQATVAAAQAIVTAAGGVVMTQDGSPVTYGNPDRKVMATPPFVAGSNEKALHPYYLRGLVA